MKPKGRISDLTVEIQNLFSDMEIDGASSGEIRISTDDYVGVPKKAQGLRPLSAVGPDNTGIGVNISQDGNTVTISGTYRNRKHTDYHITLPAAIRLRIDNASFRSDDITVRGMHNEIEVKTQVGGLKFEKVTGPIIASSLSSDINVEFSSLNQASPSSITSVSGDIDITLPASSKGDFRMSSISGEIFTNLEFATRAGKHPGHFGQTDHPASSNLAPKVPPAAPAPPVPPVPPIPPVFPRVGVSVDSTLNGGGVGVTIRSISGDIYIRKAKD